MQPPQSTWLLCTAAATIGALKEKKKNWLPTFAPHNINNSPPFFSHSFWTILFFDHMAAKRGKHPFQAMGEWGGGGGTVCGLRLHGWQRKAGLPPLNSDTITGYGERPRGKFIATYIMDTADVQQKQQNKHEHSTQVVQQNWNKKYSLDTTGVK